MKLGVVVKLSEIECGQEVVVVVVVEVVVVEVV